MFFILAYIAVGLQVGLSPHVAYHGAAPNLVLLAVVFLAMNASRDAALLACFILGVLQDLLTQQQPGLFALSYGLIALFIVGAQQAVYREHPLTHFSLALAGGLITASILLLHGWIYPPNPRFEQDKVVLPAVRLPVVTELTRVLYTALLAPLVLTLLQRLRRAFGFQPARRKAW
jgi:rod shape-determining protein MreD